MKSAKKILQNLIFIFVTIFMLIAFFVMFGKETDSDLWVENKFDLKINGNIYATGVDIDNYKLPTLKKGDVVEVSRGMKNFDYFNKFLVFRTYSSTIDVYWNNSNIYSYGHNLYEKGKFLGRGFHIVELKKVDNSNPTLIIKLKASENINFDMLNFLKFTSSHTIWSDIIILNLASVTLSISLFMLGFVGFMCFGLTSLILRNKNDHLLYSFSTSFFVGLWIACINGLFQKMTGNLELTATFEYLSLYIIPYFYISLIEMIKTNGFGMRFIFVAKKFYILFPIISSILHVTDIIHISQVVFIFRISVVIVLIMLFLISIKDYKHQKNYERILAIGNIVSSTLIAIQAVLLNFNITSFKIFDRIYPIGDFFVSVPITLVVLAPLISYSLSIRHIKDYEAQISLLKNMAYKDSLTGLYNRHRGMAFAMDLKKNGFAYSLIMIDLNNLKIVNDNFGHNTGDVLLVDFSNCMKKAFDSEEFLNIRQGGDEFVVVCKGGGVDKNNIEKNLEKLKNYIKESNSCADDNCHISIAYGVANSNEVLNEDYEAVLRLADKRMYENKALIKGKQKKNKNNGPENAMEAF